MTPRSLLILMLALGAAACGGGDPGAEVVAQVGDHEITVQDAAEYMRGSGRVATEEGVRKAVDELVQLHLVLQRARASHDLTVPESLMVHEWREILLVNQFREDVVWDAVQVDEARLRAWYDENVSEQVRVRHLLVRVPPAGAEAEKARARTIADSLHAAIAGGADFAELARQHSDDGASAPAGGLMDWFGKGEMVPAFENAALATPEGELAPLVESEFGFHILRVEGKRKQTFEELREEIEDQVMSPERGAAEEAYVTRLMETSGIEFRESNVDRFLALVKEEPPRPPTGGERSAELVTWNGGSLTVGDVWYLFENLPPANQQQIRQLDQAGLVTALSSIVQRRLVVDAATAANVEIDSTRQEQLDERIDQLYVEAYLRKVAESSLAIPDSVAERYYEEHREFYAGQPYEAVADQIRETLRTQRMQAFSAPDAQLRMVRAIADTVATEIEVTLHEDRYDLVLERLTEMYAEDGEEPPTEEPAPVGAPPTGAPPGATPPGA